MRGDSLIRMAVVMAIAALAMLIVWRASAEPDRSVAMRHAVVAATPPAPDGHDVSAAARPPLPATPAQTAPASCEVPAPAPAAADVAASGAAAEDEETRAWQRFRLLRESAIATLRGASDPRRRAAAEYFSLLATAFDGAKVHECGSDAACRRSVVTSGWQAAAAQREGLAGTAAAGSDPVVYAWAYRACHMDAPASVGETAPPGPACAQLSARQWARLDPGNAVPWLAIAREARRSGDRALIDEAMHQIAQAERVDDGFGRLAGQFADAFVTDSRLEATTDLTVAAIGFEAVQVMPNVFEIISYCKTEELGDANRAQTCDRLARSLVDRSDTLSSGLVGLAIGRRLGWSEARLGALTDERSAMMGAALRVIAGAPGETGSCASLRQTLQWMHEVGEHGEVATMRRHVAASGLTTAELASAFKRRMQPAMAAASSASSPP